MQELLLRIEYGRYCGFINNKNNIKYDKRRSELRKKEDQVNNIQSNKNGRFAQTSVEAIGNWKTVFVPPPIDYDSEDDCGKYVYKVSR